MTETVDFYTSVDRYGSEIRVCGYRDGQRYKQKIKYEPYLFIPSKEGTYKNLHGQPVARKNFANMREAQQWVDHYKDLQGFKWYGYDRWVYPFINDNWLGDIKYDTSVINRHILDIEVAKNPAGEYATVENADGQITLIGLRIKGQRFVYGWDDHKWKEPYLPPRCHYVPCRDEAHMLERFLQLWEDDDDRPDIVTGWNIERYDIPYLVNRIRKVLGEGHAERMSPWGLLREKNIEVWGNPTTIYIPVGLVILDYYDIYKKFTYKQLESYSLDHVAFHEVKRRKLDYKSQGYSDIEDLRKRNFPLFVQYNIEDLDRVHDIDEKNHFIDLACFIAYQAKVNLTDALGSVKLWEVISHNHLLNKGIVFHHDMRSEPRRIPGGFNFKPQIGPHQYVMSFDLQSLYPHLMMWTNISPECYVDMESWPLETDEEGGAEYCLKHPEIINRDFQEHSDFSRAGNGARFRRDRQGFMGELMKKFFAMRKSFKDQMIKAKNSGADEDEITRLNNAQMGIKIAINSFYGATANPAFAFYNWRISSAVTLSGQLAIRWIAQRLTEVLDKALGIRHNWTVAGDTDSIYLDLTPFVTRFVPDNPVDFLDRLGKEFIGPEIDKAYAELGKIMNSYEPDKLIMKRDVISVPRSSEEGIGNVKIPKGYGAIWRAKKCYAMWVQDAEGVRYPEPELKVMGLEVVKAIIPQDCRDAFRESIALILDGKKKETQDFIKEFRQKFNKLKVEDIAFPRGCNGLEEYHDSGRIWRKGSPIHVKGALVYNHRLKEMGLDSVYPLIHSGDKVKFVHLREPNPVHCNVVSFLQVLPPEMGLHKYVDTEMMFDKTFLEPVKSLLVLLGWEAKETRNALADLL